MKKIYTLLAIGLLVMTGPLLGSVMAQDQPSSAATAMQPPNPDEVVDTLTAKLNLSDDQKGQIKPIIADRQQKLQALRSDTSSRPRQKMRKAKGILDDSDKKIEAALNDQQKKQYAQIKQQMREQMQQRMQSRRGTAANSSQ